MSDEGWLKKSYPKFSGVVYLSDAVWLRGTVRKKYFDKEGQCCIAIKTSAKSQRGEEIMPKKSTVVLPSKERGDRPVKMRLE